MRDKITSLFKEHISRWQLNIDGDPIITSGARLLPVRYNNNVAMLKIATVDEEILGGKCMNWWEGKGAARVLAIHRNAIPSEVRFGLFAQIWVKEWLSKLNRCPNREYLCPDRERFKRKSVPGSARASRRGGRAVQISK